MLNALKYRRFALLGMLVLAMAGESFGDFCYVDAIQGRPPEIIFIDFPSKIQADGKPVQGIISFRDPDGDIVKVKFELAQGDASLLQLKPDWEFDPQVGGKIEGHIPFRLSATAPQKTVRLRVTLSDRTGKSPPKEHPFEAVQAPKTTPVLRVNPENLSFSGEVNRTIPSQTLTVTNVGGGNLRWTASTNDPWLSLSRTSGGPVGANASDAITVTVNTTNLPQGRREGRITVGSAEAWNSPLVVSVSLNLSPPPTPPTPIPILQVRPTSLNFSGKVGDTSLPSQTVEITNTGGGVLNWVAGADVPWIRLALTNGTAPATVAISVQPTGLAAGTHPGKIIINAPGAQNSPAVITVTLKLEGPLVRPPRIGISPGNFSFRAVQGGSDPAAQTLTITNIGEGVLNWAISSDVPWLNSSPTQSQLDAGKSASVTVTARIAGLGVTDHRGQITVADPKADNSPVAILVTLSIQPPPAPAVLQVSPTNLNFTGQEGGSNPDPQTVKISNEGGSSLEWTAQADANWIQASMTRGSLAPKESGQLQVATNIAGLRAGTHQTRVTITAPGAQGSPVVVTVNLTLIAPNRAPVIESLAPQRTPWGRTLSLRIQASDPDSGDTVTLEAANLPKNASFPTVRGNPAVGTFAFTPESAQARQSFTITFIATDSRGLRDTKTLSVSVEIRPIQPRIITNVFLTARPSGIAITPDNRLAYIANQGSHSVIVVDIPSAKAGDMITVGKEPLGMAINPNGRFVYVANSKSDNLFVLDTQTNKVVKQINVGKEPYGVSVAPDGTRVYVSNLRSDNISIIDAHSLEVIGEIKVEAPSAMAISPDGRYAYVASYDVAIVDLVARSVVGTIRVKEPWQPESAPWPWRLTVTPDGRFVYATIQNPNDITQDGVVVLDTQQRRLVTTIKTGNNPFGIAVMPDGGFVLATNMLSHNVSVIEVATNSVIQTIQDPLLTSRPLEVAITPDGRRALVTNASNSVTIIELTTGEQH